MYIENMKSYIKGLWRVQSVDRWISRFDIPQANGGYNFNLTVERSGGGYYIKHIIK